MHDAHVHLSFMANGERVARDAQRTGVLLFTNSVTSDDYAQAHKRFLDFENVIVGSGLHPWWVTGEETAEDMPDGPVVGEVGLDFGKRHESTREAQLSVFKHIATSCARHEGTVMSIHAVHAAHEALDILELSGALDACTCIFHWFTGPSDQLKRAITAGCYFSVGPRMIATGKGREYVKAIPAGQLLLETDAPPEQGVEYSFSQLEADLNTVANAVAAIKGEEALEIADRTFRTLFNV